MGLINGRRQDAAMNRRTLFRMGTIAASSAALVSTTQLSAQAVVPTATIALSGAPTGSVFLTSQQPFRGIVRNAVASTGSGPYIIGTDSTRIFARDVQSGGLRQSTNGLSFSAHKGMPAGVAWNDCFQIVTFKGNHYLLGRDAGANTVNIYRTAPADGDAAWAWTKVLTLTQGTAGYSTSMSASSGSLIVGEYGDPSGGPSVWRTADGGTWNRTYGPDSGIRHIHAVEHDPFNPGAVWMTCGDGIGKTIQQSLDDGATWRVVVASAGWQAVQISFDAGWVYLAADSGSHTFHVVDRTTFTPYVGTPNSHKNFAVPSPAALSDRYSTNAYMASVDPATGFVYACANEAGPGVWNGLFFTPKAGLPLQMLDKGCQDNCLNGRVHIWGGYLWCGIYHAPLLSGLII